MVESGKQFIKAFAEKGQCLGDSCPFKKACDKKEDSMPQGASVDFESQVCLETLTFYLGK